MAGRAKATEADFRQSLGRVLDETPELDDKLRSLIDQLFSSETQKTTWVTIVCQECSKKRRYEVAVPQPNYMDRIKAIDMLATQGLGRPGQSAKPPVSLDRTRAELEQASDEELLLIAAAGGVS